MTEATRNFLWSNIYCCFSELFVKRWQFSWLARRNFSKNNWKIFFAFFLICNIYFDFTKEHITQTHTQTHTHTHTHTQTHLKMSWFYPVHTHTQTHLKMSWFYPVHIHTHTHTNTLKDELILPCFFPARQPSMNFKDFISKPYTCVLAISSSWSIQWKAFERSVIRRHLKPLLSKNLRHLFLY